ncbi:uncharacterized protein KY384_001970 [Bacidia gigantensis]|uniref:uncharacterized protein n=1 Tax=Bacidia gigantensis TaxID=2732470 RepID=UPI001D036277|nr:uncharacterized protein KY384_001970 [Bacidia gigantensis]KAG8533187.1 hypothetical protein KY384_001970 [Bacidia gigantensis]
MSTNPAARDDLTSHVAVNPNDLESGEGRGGEEGKGEEEHGGALTQANVASRRLWIGLKYFNNRPVLEKMRLVSKPTRRVAMGLPDLEGLVVGQNRGSIRGLRGIGEAMFMLAETLAKTKKLDRSKRRLNNHRRPSSPHIDVQEQEGTVQPCDE